jgi:hypothetical protein
VCSKQLEEQQKLINSHSQETFTIMKYKISCFQQDKKSFSTWFLLFPDSTLIGLMAVLYAKICLQQLHSLHKLPALQEVNNISSA